MRTINLSDFEKSEIKYKISQFPDGQQDIVVNLNNLVKTFELLTKREYEEELTTIFKDSKLTRETTLEQIRERIRNN